MTVQCYLWVYDNKLETCLTLELSYKIIDACIWLAYFMSHWLGEKLGFHHQRDTKQVPWGWRCPFKRSKTISAGSTGLFGRSCGVCHGKAPTERCSPEACQICGCAAESWVWGWRRPILCRQARVFTYWLYIVKFNGHDHKTNLSLTHCILISTHVLFKILGTPSFSWPKGAGPSKWGVHQLTNITMPEDPTVFDVEEFWGRMASTKNKVRNILHTQHDLLIIITIKGKCLSNRGLWFLFSKVTGLNQFGRLSKIAVSLLPVFKTWEPWERKLCPSEKQPVHRWAREDQTSPVQRLKWCC